MDESPTGDKHTTVRRIAPAVLLILVGLAFAPPWWLSQPQQRLVGRAFVIDGDTIRIGDERIGILDIEAPDGRQTCGRPDAGQWPCGERAMLALSAWIGQQTVTCRAGERDVDETRLAQCSVGDADIARWLVSEGWAVPSPHCLCPLIRLASWRAKTDALGLWSSSFVMPWDWRNAD
jgi:endonuclease YncB( thermonuclease family)